MQEAQLNGVRQLVKDGDNTSSLKVRLLINCFAVNVTSTSSIQLAILNVYGPQSTYNFRLVYTDALQRITHVCLAQQFPVVTKAITGCGDLTV